MIGLIIDLVLTVFGYLIFPIIYLFGTGRVERSKAKKIALINSIVCAIIFSIIRYVISGDFSISIPVGVGYYFLVRAILTDKSLSEKPTSSENKKK